MLHRTGWQTTNAVATPYAGIYFESGSNGKAESNIFAEGNATSGIIINASSPYLSANRLPQNNAQYGLVYGKSSKPTFGAKK